MTYRCFSDSTTTAKFWRQYNWFLAQCMARSTIHGSCGTANSSAAAATTTTKALLYARQQVGISFIIQAIL